MEKKETKLIIILALIATITIMSVGYASLAQRLIVNGSANLGDAKWNVKIVEIRETDKNITGTEIIPNTSVGSLVGHPNIQNALGSTTATFNVDLNEPGDYAEFTVTVKNLGNIAAKLNSITDLVSVNSEFPEAIKYTVTPDVTNSEILASNEYHYYKVRVDYTSEKNNYTEEILESINTESDGTTVKLASKTATIHFDYIQG